MNSYPKPGRHSGVYFNSERIVEAEWWSERQMKPAFVFRLHAVINGFTIRTGLLFQNRGKCRARVFRIDVDASGQNPLMRDVSSAEIEAALDWKMSFVFDLLRDQFAKDDLLGEIFAPNDDVRMRSAGGEDCACSASER
jgi:hypothetical protein